MVNTVVDLLTFLQARFVSKMPDIVVTRVINKCMAATVRSIGILSQPSETVRFLEKNLPDLRVAQIGGITQSMFDQAGEVIRFNTNDWRSGEAGGDGGRYIRIRGTELPVEDGAFDVVDSRHVLEHIANCVAALLEWKRILKKGGYLYVSVPNRFKTHEHLRTLTTLSHFIEDHEDGVGEFDPRHEEEIRQTGVGIIQHDRYENPHIHYHTFEENNLRRLLVYCGLDIVELTAHDLSMFRHQPWDLIMIARKA